MIASIMSDHTLPPSTLIRIAGNWHLGENNGFLASLHDPDKPDEYVNVTATALGELHPALPNALRSLLLWNKENRDKPHAEDDCVRATLDLLNGDIVTIRDPLGRDRVFTNITSIGQNEDKSDFIWLRGTELDVRRLSTSDTSLSFVVSTSTRETLMYRTSIENSYPGWEQRWLLGKDLGIDRATLINNVFQTAIEPSENLLAVQFDI